MLYLKNILQLLKNKNLYLIFASIIISRQLVNSIEKSIINREKKYAIICVPGLFNCGLFKLDKMTQTYKNVFLNKIDDIYSTITNKENLQKKINIIECSQNGIPLKKTVQPIEKDQIFKISEPNDRATARYGINMIFKKIIHEIKQMLKDNEKYKVYMFNYDWRLSVKTNGEKLAEEINKYDKVILIGFSLGGLISSYSFTKLYNKNQLHKIKGFIACGVPFLGSSDAVYFLFDKIDISEILSLYASLAIRITVPSDNIITLQKIVKNMQSIYDLLPHQILNTKEANTNFLPINDLINTKLIQNAKNVYNEIYENEFKWWKQIDNIYVIYGDSYKTRANVIWSKDNNKGVYTSEYGDDTVTIKSAYPEFLKQHAKGVYEVHKTKHRDLLNNNNVKKKIIQYIKTILKIETNNTKVE